MYICSQKNQIVTNEVLSEGKKIEVYNICKPLNLAVLFSYYSLDNKPTTSCYSTRKYYKQIFINEVL